MPKAINFGSLNIDYVYSVPHIVRPGETLLSKDFNRYCGGKGANQSLALAGSGAMVKHAGQIGKDGIFLKEKLEAAGVDVEHVKLGNAPTGQAIIQVADDGQNSIVLFPGANRAISPEQIDAALEDAKEGDILLLQNEINNNELIIEKAYEKGMEICLNPAPFDESISELSLHLVHILVVNEIEGKGLSEEVTPEAAVEKLSIKYPDMTIVMTLGEKGVICKREGEKILLPARKVNVVDTTAAGDTFIGYFIGGRLQGLSLEESLRHGILAASISIGKPGAADSIPSKNELIKLG
jgi:ribokinase